jgi:hypothetical protein
MKIQPPAGIEAGPKKFKFLPFFAILKSTSTIAAAVLFGLAGSARRLLHSRRERADWAADGSGDDREDRELSREQFERGAMALFRGSTHDEMRQADAPLGPCETDFRRSSA